VTLHELAHSLAAAWFGIKVSKITLLPVGGIASMAETPEDPRQELIISLAGPVSNLLVIIVLFYPLKAILGTEALMYPLKVFIGRAQYTAGFSILAHIYWINLILAVFNLIPAFPMDGGRVLRAALTYSLGYKRATAAAVKIGQVFAVLFAFYGFISGNIILLIIAVFLYAAASGEAHQVNVHSVIRNFTVEDVLPDKDLQLREDTPLWKVLETVFHTHQEDFTVFRGDEFSGILTRKELMRGIHEKGKEVTAAEVLRKDVPAVKVLSRLDVAQKLMYKYNTKALPVESNGTIIGLITMDDINRVYIMAEGSQRKGRMA
jgi:stage IV sporulation protein FB